MDYNEVLHEQVKGWKVTDLLRFYQELWIAILAYSFAKQIEEGKLDIETCTVQLIHEFLDDTVEIPVIDEKKGEQWFSESAILFLYTADDAHRQEYWQSFVGGLIASFMPDAQDSVIEALTQKSFKWAQANNAIRA